MSNWLRYADNNDDELLLSYEEVFISKHTQRFSVTIFQNLGSIVTKTHENQMTFFYYYTQTLTKKDNKSTEVKKGLPCQYFHPELTSGLTGENTRNSNYLEVLLFIS